MLVSISGNVIIEPMEIAYELVTDGPVLIGLIRDEKYSQVVVKGSESAGAVVYPLTMAKPLQL